MAGTEEKRPVGRPRTKLDDLPANWEESMYEAAQDGASFTEIRCILGIERTAWATLEEDYDQFRAAVKRSKDLCEVWWERRGRQMSVGGEGNATVWIFNMKNRFAWRDQPEPQQDDNQATPVNVVVNVKDARKR